MIGLLFGIIGGALMFGLEIFLGIFSVLGLIVWGFAFLIMLDKLKKPINPEKFKSKDTKK